MLDSLITSEFIPNTPNVPPKVLFIASSGNFGGGSTALLNLLLYLGDRIQPTVVFPHKGPFSEQVENQGITCVYRPVPFLSYPPFLTLRQRLFFPYELLKTCWRNQKSISALRHYMQAKKPDLVHTNVGPVQAGFRAAKRLNIQHIWHLREYQEAINMTPFPSIGYYRKLLQDSGNHTIAISEGIKEHYNKQATIIHDGVIDASNPVPMINLDKEPYLLFVGRLEDAKGAMDALNAYLIYAAEASASAKNHTSTPVLKMVFAGAPCSDAYLSAMKQRIREAGLETNVHFLGYSDTVDQLMAKSRAIIVASRSEGFGFITVEAMYNGCLVIGRDNSGTKMQLDNGKHLTGSEIGLRYTSQAALVSHLKDVATQPASYYLPMLQNAQKTVCQLYTKQAHANAVYQVYLNLLKHKNNSSN